MAPTFSARSDTSLITSSRRERAARSEIVLEYDPRDGWEHEITLLGKAHPSLRTALHIPREQKAFCYAGQGFPTLEDCGGVDAWQLAKVSGIIEDPHEWYMHGVNNKLRTGSRYVNCPSRYRYSISH